MCYRIEGSLDNNGSAKTGCGFGYRLHHHEPGGPAPGWARAAPAAPQLQYLLTTRLTMATAKDRPPAVSVRRNGMTPNAVGLAAGEARNHGRPDPDQHGGIADAEGHRLDD